MSSMTCETTDLLVFSHLRWDFVFQRPQHLLSRSARYRRVYFFEEPVFGMTDFPRLHLRETPEGVQVVVPYLPSTIKNEDVEIALKELVDELIFDEEVSSMTTWYYTPMALLFTRHLEASITIFDCMDELSLFKGAPQTLMNLESELMKRADLVFTGGYSLYEAKKHAHHNIHPFPSSIDYAHFSQGRLQMVEPDDQAHIPHPRIGFYGVVDERFDLELLQRMAEIRPDFQFIIIGPITKIDPETLPVRANIHYLGKKDYQTLPLYLGGWDCAMIPFALNESTRFISPTKTPEYLAAGKPVVSTPIRDVVRPYGDEELVKIASSPEEFILCVEQSIEERAFNSEWINRVDNFLAEISWDHTFSQMAQLERESLRLKRSKKDMNIHSVSISAGGVI